ncbi:MAG: Hsp70 family protein, partial [Myxococcota bacterium]|nr:Hsp70 family protein [Myxococcota bacterium]
VGGRHPTERAVGVRPGLVDRGDLPGIAESADGPLDVDMSIDRATLEMLTEDLVQRTMDTTRRILDEAGLEPGQVDEIILVGGQTRMPHIIEALEGLTGRTPNRSINPQEAVAIGAAIMTHSMVGSSGQDLSLLDVLAMPIGINKVDGTMHVLFSKNQPLPSYKTRSLTTSKDDQTSIRIRLYQGESRTAEHNELLGTFVLHNLRPAPKGEVNVKIHFHVDSQGVLTLSGEDAETGESIDVRVKMGKPGDIKAVTRDHGKSDEDPSQQTTEEIKTDIPDDPEKRAGGMMSWFKKVLGGD